MKNGNARQLSKIVAGALAAGAMLFAGEAGAATAGFLIQGDTLWRIETNPYGRHAIGTGWTGASSMAYRESSAGSTNIHVIHNSKLWIVDRFTGQRTPVTTGRSWGGTTNMAFTVGGSVDGSLFIVQSGRMWHVNNPDNPTDPRVNEYGGDNWDSTTSMTAIGNQLYVIRGSSLRRLSSIEPVWTNLGPDVWSGFTRMTRHRWSGGDPGSLYVFHNDDLWRVDPNTGSRTIFGTANAWPTFTTIFCNGQATFTSNLFAIQDINDLLLRVDNAGGWHRTDNLRIYGGPIVSAGTNCYF